MPTITAPYAGADQPDVASLTQDGDFFRCYVWRNASRNTIDGLIFIEQESGQDVVVWSGVIRDVEADGAALAQGDCPKVTFSETNDGIFIAHWVEWVNEGAVTLHRATFPVSSFVSAWTYRGNIAIQDWALYDHAPVRNDPYDDIVTAHVSGLFEGGGVLTVARYQYPFNWTGGSVVWTSTSNQNLAPRVLSLVAEDDTLNDALICAFQLNGTQQLHSFLLNSVTGATVVAATEVFGDMPEDGEFSAVGMVQYPGVSNAAVVAELCPATAYAAGTPDNLARMVACRDISGTTLTPTFASNYVHNMHLVSRPWTSPNAHSWHEVYCLASFKGLATDREWDQTYGYVLRWHRDRWELTGSGQVRPSAVSAITNGSFDGRSCGRNEVQSSAQLNSAQGSKRINHLSSVSRAPQWDYGPDVASVTVAALHFSQNMASEDNDAQDGERTVALATVRGVRFYMDDPWGVRDTVEQPALPDGANFRSVAQYEVAENEEFGPAMLIAGGVLSAYDGRQIVENGFCWYPEIVDIDATNGPGAGDIGPGDYWVTATYTWTSRDETQHRSAPATPRLMSPAVELTDYTVRVRNVNLTQKDDRGMYPDAPAVSIEIWRTTLVAGSPEESSGSYVFRREFQGSTIGINLTPRNDPTDWVQSVVCSNPDSVITNNDILPWQLNTTTLQWSSAVPIPVTSLRAMAKWKNRAFGVAMDDPSVIVYSDEQLPIGPQNIAAEFFDTNRFRFDSRGAIVAMHEMDNQLIIFTRDAVYSMTGEGNDGTGTGSTLSIQALATGTGCIEPRSVVLTPIGVMFQSGKGFYIVSKALEMDYASAGAAIEDRILSVGNVRSATLLPDRHEVRFVCNDPQASGDAVPVVLTFNYEHKLWSESGFVNLAADGGLNNAMMAARAWRGREGQVCHVVLQKNGLAVERGDTDTDYSDQDYADVSQPVPLDAQTEWIHLSGMAGLKRVPVIGIQTERVNDGAMTVQAWYDFDGSFDETTPDETFIFASPAPAYLPIKPGSQKFTSVMLRVFESGTVPPTENVRLVSITLKIGQKRGLRKVPSSQFGT